MAELDDEWQRRYTEAEEEHNSIQQQLNAENEELEARVDDLLEALRPEGASGEGRASRPPRVVPRSKGVLCAGCLTQILYREVKPVASAGELRTATRQRLHKERDGLFEKTVGGPDPQEPA